MTHEQWRELAIARMWNALPYEQKHALFDPYREHNPIDYWGSWLEGATIAASLIDYGEYSKGKTSA